MRPLKGGPAGGPHFARPRPTALICQNRADPLFLFMGYLRHRSGFHMPAQTCSSLLWLRVPLRCALLSYLVTIDERTADSHLLFLPGRHQPGTRALVPAPSLCLWLSLLGEAAPAGTLHPSTDRPAQAPPVSLLCHCPLVRFAQSSVEDDPGSLKQAQALTDGTLPIHPSRGAKTS